MPVNQLSVFSNFNIPQELNNTAPQQKSVIPATDINTKPPEEKNDLVFGKYTKTQAAVGILAATAISAFTIAEIILRRKASPDKTFNQIQEITHNAKRLASETGSIKEHSRGMFSDVMGNITTGSKNGWQEFTNSKGILCKFETNDQGIIPLKIIEYKTDGDTPVKIRTSTISAISNKKTVVSEHQVEDVPQIMYIPKKIDEYVKNTIDRYSYDPNGTLNYYARNVDIVNEETNKIKAKYVYDIHQGTKIAEDDAIICMEDFEGMPENLDCHTQVKRIFNFYKTSYRIYENPVFTDSSYYSRKVHSGRIHKHSTFIPEKYIIDQGTPKEKIYIVKDDKIELLEE